MSNQERIGWDRIKEELHPTGPDRIGGVDGQERRGEDRIGQEWTG